MSQKRSRKQKIKKEKIDEVAELESDENFAYIVGYTSGGAPYGLKHEDMAELEKENDKSENNSKKINKCRQDKHRQLGSQN